MSYDLYALALAAGEDPAQKLDRLESEALERPSDPEIERRRRDLAQALLSGTPELERAERDYTALADLMGITETQAREGDRSIELGRADIEVTLEDEHAWIEIQFGSPDRVPETLDGLRRMLGILASEVGWSTYDPQLERVLDLDRDLDAVEAKLMTGAAHAEKLSQGEWF